MNITLKYNMDIDEWVRAHAIDTKRQYISMAAVFAVFLIIFVYTKQDLKFIGLALGAALIIILIFVVILRLSLLSDFKKFKFANEELKWRITDELIIIDSIENYHTETEWAKVNNIIENRDGFMFVAADRQFSYLPRSAFKNPADMETFIGFVKEKGIKYKYSAL